MCEQISQYFSLKGQVKENWWYLILLLGTRKSQWPEDMYEVVTNKESAHISRCRINANKSTKNAENRLTKHFWMTAVSDWHSNVKPAVHDGTIGLSDGESQLLHVRPVQTDMAALAGQRHQHQTRLLPARHHVAVFCDHQPVSAIITNKAVGSPSSRHITGLG